MFKLIWFLYVLSFSHYAFSVVLETGLFKPDFLNRIFLHQESGELGLIKRV